MHDATAQSQCGVALISIDSVRVRVRPRLHEHVSSEVHPVVQTQVDRGVLRAVGGGGGGGCVGAWGWVFRGGSCWVRSCGRVVVWSCGHGNRGFNREILRAY